MKRHALIMSQTSTTLFHKTKMTVLTCGLPTLIRFTQTGLIVTSDARSKLGVCTVLCMCHRKKTVSRQVNNFLFYFLSQETYKGSPSKKRLYLLAFFHVRGKHHMLSWQAVLLLNAIYSSTELQRLLLI